jgi:hypothetical protein
MHVLGTITNKKMPITVKLAAFHNTYLKPFSPAQKIDHQEPQSKTSLMAQLYNIS